MAGPERLWREPAGGPASGERRSHGPRPAASPPRAGGPAAWLSAAQAANGPRHRLTPSEPVQRHAARSGWPVQRQAADPDRSPYLDALTQPLANQTEVDQAEFDQAEFDRGHREGLRQALGPYDLNLLINVVFGAALGLLLAYAAPVYLTIALALGLAALISSVIGTIGDRITEFTADTGRGPTGAELVNQGAQGVADLTGLLFIYEGNQAQLLSGGKLTPYQAGWRCGYGRGLFLLTLVSLGAGLLANRLNTLRLRRLHARLPLAHRLTVPAPAPKPQAKRSPGTGTAERGSAPQASKLARKPPAAPSHPAVTVAAGGPLWQIALRMGGSRRGTVRPELPQIRLDPDDFLRRPGNSWMMLGEGVENGVLTARSLGGDERAFAFTPPATATLESALRDGPVEFTVRQADDLLGIGRQASGDLLDALERAQVLRKVADRETDTYRFGAVPGNPIIPVDPR